MFNRRAAAGQCFHRPCLGTREFAADFELVAEGAELPTSSLPAAERDKDLGWMVFDDHYPGMKAKFFRARLVDGVIDVQRCLAEGTAA
jgi:CRISPR-associated protein Cas5d